MQGFEYWLPLIFFFLSIGPFWDANETWIVLGVGILLIAFPQAHGKVLTALYLPVTFMLMGLIIRGVAFDFRVKAGEEHKAKWNNLFFIGSLIATLCQGWMIGSYITGLTGATVNMLFSCLISLSLPFLYIVLGASWLLIKTEGKLLDKSICWARKALLPMGIALFMVSIATPIVSQSIADKWFTVQNFIGLVPIPFTTILAYVAVGWVLTKPEVLKQGWEWVVMVGVIVICIMAGQLTMWEAAAATSSLQVILVGACISIPAIVGYTIFVYYIFRGKAVELSYGE